MPSETPPKPVDPAAFAVIGAEALRLVLTEDQKLQVAAHLAVAFRLAPLFLDFPLDDDAEPAPVFKP